MRSLLSFRTRDPETAFCGGCGEKLPTLGAHAIACPYCGSDLHPFEPESLAFEEMPVETAKVNRHAGTAALLSLVVPGAGQVFNGHFLRGFVILGTFWLVIPWIFGVIDAWVSARREMLRPGAPQLL